MPSVFKLSLSIKRTRPRTLAGKPAMISTEPADCGLLGARRTAVPAGRSANVFGARINPANALAATTAGGPQNTHPTPAPHRPLKIKIIGLVSHLPRFPQPPPPPAHAAAPPGQGRSTASTQ